MPDSVDFVQEHADELIQDALIRHKQFMPTGASLKKCCVCFDDIPEARRVAYPGVVKCYRCQLEYEQMHGKWGEM